MNTLKDESETPNDDATQDQVIEQKLVDAEIPGFEAEFDPLEAEKLGAFTEDALSEQDAKDSCGD